MTRADASALVALIYELCGDIPEDSAQTFKAVLANHDACLHLLCEAFPDVDSLSGEPEDNRAALLEIVWSANDVSFMLEDMQRESDEHQDDEPDPLSWPKLLLKINRYFGVDAETVLHKWTYWQFKAYMAALTELLDETGGDADAQESQGVPMEELLRRGITSM